MVSQDTRNELQEYLGQVPSFMEAESERAGDHSWGIMRDLTLEDTELTTREKVLVGIGASAGIGCPYCIHFHKEEAKLEEVSEEGLREAFDTASMVRYFSAVLHGAEVDLDEFRAETAEIMAHVEQQHAAADDD